MQRSVLALREGVREYPIFFDIDAYHELLDHIEGGEEFDETHPRVLALLESDPGNRIVIHPLLAGSPHHVLTGLIHEALHITERRTGLPMDPTDEEASERKTDAYALALTDILMQSGIVLPGEIEFGTIVERPDVDEE